MSFVPLFKGASEVLRQFRAVSATIISILASCTSRTGLPLAVRWSLRAKRRCPQAAAIQTLPAIEAALA